MSTEVRELRAEIRHWRRGRATARLVDVLSDAYVALLAVAMFGSALVNVVLNVRRAAGAACVAAGCLEARTVLPWVTGVAGVVLVLALARLFGPVFVSPAVDSWLMTAPVDRGSVLRPRLLGAVGIALVGGGLVAAGASAVAAFPGAALLSFTFSAALLSAVAVCLAALSQSAGGVVARLLTWVLVAAVWGGLLVLALGRAPVADPPVGSPAWVTGVLVAAALTLALLALAVRRLPRLRRRDVAAGGALAPGVSGALASLDLALAFDVVVAHRWTGHGSVRPRRGGPSGAAALVWLDLTRVRRSPQTVLLLVAAVVVPYATETAGGGRVVVLVAALTGFLTGLPLLTGVRALTRTPSIARAMPFPAATTRMATLAVPAGLLAAYGLATAGALDGSLGVDPGHAVVFGVVVGAAALAAATRWVTGRPPDYSKPLVTTPAGAVPTNLYGSAARGFDVLVLTTAPVLISPTGKGAVISLLFSLGVLGYLVGRE
ncbi:DUF6297 family protein [Nocardioides panaciterrulae]|uniref:ABC-2 type transport system permease protein n=1 Tax=Nocardioides panaciterrulae TaxID=661492 RepID=A0A7Y9E8R1_9ACTN|nr:DUF6297 family protein [Nocardioides panaciterrulae]NYD43301.1 hypothetical protein [Nocardioides panaciterrulae]